jgi:hypothetical protein
MLFNIHYIDVFYLLHLLVFMKIVLFSWSLTLSRVKFFHTV